MMAVFFVALTEMVFLRRSRKALRNVEAGTLERDEKVEIDDRNMESPPPKFDVIQPAVSSSTNLAAQSLKTVPGEHRATTASGGSMVVAEEDSDSESQIWHGKGLSPSRRHKKALLQVLLLEMGILFHSVFIGMTLSVIVGNEFVILLIAIAFHQTFEGLALGSRIAVLHWESGDWRPWAMALAYGCT